MAEHAKIRVTADSAQAERSMLSLGKSLDNTTGKMLDMSGVAGMLAGALSIGAFSALIKSAINTGDELAKLSQKTGTTVEELAGLKFAADQNGASLDSVARAGQKLAAVMADKADVFKGLGVTATSSTGAMVQLADVFAKMPDGMDKSALATKLFGDRLGADMIPFLNQGTQALGELIEKGQQFAPFTTEAAHQAEVFNDTLDELKARASGFGVAITVDLLPKLTETVKAINDLSASGTSFINVGGAISTVFETIVVLGANVGYVFKQTGREIGGMAAQLVALASGDFEGFKRIGQQMREDAIAARKEIDAFSERIINGPKKVDAAPAAEPQDGKAGKGLLDGLTGAAKTNTDELEKLRQKDIAGWVKYAEAVLAEDERLQEMLRKQAEDEALRQQASDLAWEQGVAARLAKIQEANLTEEEVERGKLIQIQNDLQFALQSRFITEQQYHEMREQAQQQHEAKYGNIMAQAAIARQKFLQMTATQQTQTVLGQMVEMTNGVATKNRELFEINKVAGIANAVVNTYTGVSKTLAAYPYPWNLPMAALHLVSGLAQIDAISSASFGGSTSAPTIGGGGAVPVTSADPGGASSFQAAAAIPEIEKPRQAVSVTFTGSGRYTMNEVVDGIVPLLKEAAGNGAIDLQVGFA